MSYSHYIHQDHSALTYIEKALANGYVKSNVLRYHDAISASPELCLVPDVYKHRHRVVGPDGTPKRHNVSYRALLWYHEKGELPELGFGAPTCGTRNCVNPAHQVPVVSTTPAFTQVEPAKALEPAKKAEGKQ